MKTYKLTQWHDGKIKPVHVGVYQRFIFLDTYAYSFWNGYKWRAYRATIGAAEIENVISIHQNLRWRGLVVKP